MLFTKMALKARKEALACSKAQAKVKSFKAKKKNSVERRLQPQKKRRYAHLLPSQGPRHRGSKGTPRRNRLDHYAIIKFPPSHEEDRLQQHTCVYVDVKANKHQIKQAVKKLYDMDVAKVNTLLSLVGPTFCPTQREQHRDLKAGSSDNF